jgi:hypothetical protein
LSALKRHRRAVSLVAATALVVGGVVASINGVANASGADPASGSLVEDFSYPDGTADPGITLTKGDGHLIKVDCDLGESQIKAVSLDDRGGKHTYCFQALGAHGFVQMILVGAFQVWADEDHTVTAKYTVDGESATATVPPDEIGGIGIGESRNTATLLELRV